MAHLYESIGGLFLFTKELRKQEKQMGKYVSKGD